MNIDVDRLSTFIHLAQEGSFTASGKSLRKSQSAVSLQIAGLERQFGLQLIDRRVHCPGSDQGNMLISQMKVAKKASFKGLEVAFGHQKAAFKKTRMPRANPRVITVQTVQPLRSTPRGAVQGSTV